MINHRYLRAAVLAATSVAAIGLVSGQAQSATVRHSEAGGTVLLNAPLPLILAQATGTGDNYGKEDGEGSESGAGALSGSKAVILSLREASSFCAQMPGDEYVIDCLAYEYWEIQRRLPKYGELADAKKVLQKTSQELKQLAASNRSTKKPQIRATRRGPKPRQTTRNLVPVETSKLPALSQEAARIINNGATLLLRATGDSDRKRIQYQQIARSMQTGAIMLRSL